MEVVTLVFRDREEAGHMLAARLGAYSGKSDVIVLAIPRGGVVVGAEVAEALHLPLDVIVVRKIGTPGNPELAAGAVDEQGRVMQNPDVPVSDEYLRDEAGRQREEVVRRLREYRGGRREPVIAGKTVLLVDDGIATGLTAMKAIDSVRAQGAAKVVLAAPVMAADTVRHFRGLADDVIAVDTPAFFYAVGAFYDYFPQTTDEEVKDLLASHAGSATR